MNKQIKPTIKIKEKDIAFEFTGKNNKKIISFHLNKSPKGQYRNDVIGLKITSENESANMNLLMTPYEAFVIFNALNQALLIHKESNKRWLK